jgi:hypothetical protein
MSDRYTRKDAELALDRLLNAIGGRRAKSYNDVGAFRLDYAAVYGGYSIEQIDNDGGGISQPFGPRRRTARELVDTVNFALHALRIYRDVD